MDILKDRQCLDEFICFYTLAEISEMDIEQLKELERAFHNAMIDFCRVANILSRLVKSEEELKDE